MGDNSSSMMADSEVQAQSRPRDICERSFAFAVDIVRACKTMERSDKGSAPLVRQLLRSGTSVGANIEEAQGGQSRADFISKYAIARKEARETRYWLRLLVAADLAAKENLAPLEQEANELIAILTAIIKKAETNKERIR